MTMILELRIMFVAYKLCIVSNSFFVLFCFFLFLLQTSKGNWMHLQYQSKLQAKKVSKKIQSWKFHKTRLNLTSSYQRAKKVVSDSLG